VNRSGTFTRTQVVGVALLGAAAAACATAPGRDERVSVEQPIDGPAFVPVADFLVQRCGTLDCHGSPYRSLRVYGRYGLREPDAGLAAGETIDGGAPAPTTAHEYAESYRSVVALEPEILRDVVRERGARPERLTLVRKARGTEAHKGGTTLDQDQDTCIVSWLSGAVDEGACRRGTCPPPALRRPCTDAAM
jgi:hypothetical protein